MADNRFHWTITTLTPLHVGNGERLREGFDFIEHDGALWIANQGALFREVLEEALRVRTGNKAKIAAEIAGMTIYQMANNKWLRPEHFDTRGGIFSYRLEGATSKKGRAGELFAHIKDIESRPYLPGSSIKGALRSAVLRAVSAQDTHKPEIQHGNPKIAAKRMEQRYFAAPDSDWSKFPYFDLWRALRITDSVPLSKEKLALGQAMVYKRPEKTSTGKTGEAESIPIDLEVIPADETLEMHSWVDDWLLTDEAANTELGLRSKSEWITTGLCRILNEESRLRLVEEVTLFRALARDFPGQHKGTQLVLDHLADVYQSLASCEMLLPVGKGTGWRSKTLGRVLQEKMTNEEFEKLVQEFNLGRGKWKREESIPYTRMLVSVGRQNAAPMGWIKVRLEADKRA